MLPGVNFGDRAVTILGNSGVPVTVCVFNRPVAAI